MQKRKGCEEEAERYEYSYRLRTGRNSKCKLTPQNASKCTERNLTKVVCKPNATLTNRHAKPLPLCLLNARSVRNKTAVLLDYARDSKADLFAINETWLNQNDSAARAELRPEGFKFLDCPRIGRNGGGTGLLYRSSLTETLCLLLFKASLVFYIQCVPQKSEL